MKSVTFLYLLLMKLIRYSGSGEDRFESSHGESHIFFTRIENRFDNSCDLTDSNKIKIIDVIRIAMTQFSPCVRNKCRSPKDHVIFTDCESIECYVAARKMIDEKELSFLIVCTSVPHRKYNVLAHHGRFGGMDGYKVFAELCHSDSEGSSIELAKLPTRNKFYFHAAYNALRTLPTVLLKSKHANFANFAPFSDPSDTKRLRCALPVRQDGATVSQGVYNIKYLADNICNALQTNRTFIRIAISVMFTPYDDEVNPASCIIIDYATKGETVHSIKRKINERKQMALGINSLGRMAGALPEKQSIAVGQSLRNHIDALFSIYFGRETSDKAFPKAVEMIKNHAVSFDLARLYSPYIYAQAFGLTGQIQTANMTIATPAVSFEKLTSSVNGTDTNQLYRYFDASLHEYRRRVLERNKHQDNHDWHPGIEVC